MCIDTHNTRQGDKCFQRRKKQYLLSHGGKEIFWDLSEKDLWKKKYWSWNWDSLGFIQLEMRVEAIQGRVNLMIQGHLFLY